MDVGARLTKFREAKGLSKNRLAKIVGVTQGFISQLELGNRLPTLEVLNRICSALGISLSEFFAENGQELVAPPGLPRRPKGVYPLLIYIIPQSKQKSSSCLKIFLKSITE